MRVFDDVLTLTGGDSQLGSGLRWVGEADRPTRRRFAAWRRPSWRTSAPSARAQRADMSRTAFMVLVSAWVAAVATVMMCSLALRWLG